MNNFIFKSPRRLIKNSSLDLVSIIAKNVDFLLKEQRCQRYDLKILHEKLDKLLVDKHLQMQVDEYFTEDKQHPPIEDLD